MALIAVAADKGAPGVTTASVVLAAVWPRAVVLAECDPAGGDLVYRFPAAGGGRLDPRRGLLSLAVAARRGMTPQQVTEHTQTLRGGLHVLTGVTTAEQGAGLEPLWGTAGTALSQLPGTDVIADCGRLGVDGPYYDLLAQASAIVLITRHNLAEVVRLRERIPALTMALAKRDRVASSVLVVVIADHKGFHAALGEVGQALGHGKGRTSVIGGLAYEPRTARQLRGEWGGRLDKSLLARTARDVAGQLAAVLPAFGGSGLPDRRGRAARPALPSRARPDTGLRPDARAPWEGTGPGTAVAPGPPPARGRHAGFPTAVPATNGAREEPAAELPPWWFTSPADRPDAGAAG
jgi:hypothetical protein